MKHMNIMEIGHDSMVRIPDDDHSKLLAVGLIVIFGISGAIGGCANFAHLFIMKEQTIKWLRVLAYALLGSVFGPISIGILSAASHLLGWDINISLFEAIGIAMAFGFGGSLALTGANIAIRLTSKALGDLELQITARQKNEERRTGKVRKSKGQKDD